MVLCGAEHRMEYIQSRQTFGKLKPSFNTISKYKSQEDSME